MSRLDFTVVAIVTVFAMVISFVMMRMIKSESTLIESSFRRRM
ncbi:MAG: hypothetical protein QOH96_798 [Blastocatellia bacterium]|nr:hypothetical protein [Blastocatellia bacterium]